MDASHFESEVSETSLGRKWTLRADGIKVPRWKVFSLHRQPEGPR